MNAQQTVKRMPKPKGTRLRKLMPEDNFIEQVHEHAQRIEQPPRTWPITGLIVVFTTAFLFAGPALRFADQTAAAVDIGAISLLLLVLVGLLSLHLLAVTCTRWLFRWIQLVEVISFSQPSNNLTSWQYVCIFFGCYASLFWGGIALLWVVMG